MTVYIPSPLRSYTKEKPSVEGYGETLAGVLADLDRRYPGIRFRMIDEQDRVREHIRFFVELEPVKDLSTPTAQANEIHIICALSGGAGETISRAPASKKPKMKKTGKEPIRNESR